MKSFSQFLQESYLSEQEAVQGRILNRKNQAYKDINNPNPGNRGYATDPTPLPANRRLGSAAPEAPKEVPGQQVIRQTSNPPTTKALEPGKPGAPLAKPTNQIPDAMAQGAYDAARSNPRTGTSSNPTATPSTPPSSTPQRRPPAANTTPQRRPPSANPSSKVEVLGKPPSGSPPRSPGGALALRPQGSSALTTPAGSQSNVINVRATTVPTPAKPKIPGLKSGGAISAALGTADEKMSGSGWLRSLAKGATVGTGAVLGGLAGGAAGTAIAPGAGTAIGGFAGQAAGAAAAEKAFDTVAGANAVTRKAMATANRQRQAGTAIKGIGGQTTFSQKKPGGPAFMSTGVGNQRRTVQLAKTGVVQRGNQSVAGHLAFKDGKAVYKAGPSAQSLAQTSSNPLERIGRSLFAGAYKQHDAAKAQQALQKARQNDAARNKKLGVKALPGK